jgi:hypothetical protein
MIPFQITWSLDPVVAGGMVRENAERGFRVLSFIEFPATLRPPSLHTSHWDRLLAACEESVKFPNLKIPMSERADDHGFRECVAHEAKGTRRSHQTRPTRESC